MVHSRLLRAVDQHEREAELERQTARLKGLETSKSNRPSLGDTGLRTSHRRCPPAGLQVMKS